MITAILNKRGVDSYGSGEFGAPRGSRTHRGIDYICPPNTAILSPCVGIVSRLGYAYSDDLSYRYVQIDDEEGAEHRVFYVEPTVEVGASVSRLCKIGVAQDIERRYPGISPHIHYEIREKGAYVNPEQRE